jgi:hypothetical protein
LFALHLGSGSHYTAAYDIPNKLPGLHQVNSNSKNLGLIIIEIEQITNQDQMISGKDRRTLGKSLDNIEK